MVGDLNYIIVSFVTSNTPRHRFIAALPAVIYPAGVSVTPTHILTVF